MWREYGDGREGGYIRAEVGVTLGMGAIGSLHVWMVAEM